MVFQVSTFLSLGLILFLYLHTPVLAGERLTYCAVTTGKTQTLVAEECQYIEEINHKGVKCNMQPDRVSCLQHLINGTADFMIAEPEDLLMLSMTPEYNEKLLVAFELRVNESAYAKYHMVVLLHKNIEEMKDTEHSFLCLPDLEREAIYDTKYFEKHLVVSECDPRETLIENRISALSNYFGKACIAGPWITDNFIDTNLKTKYKNLCSACHQYNGSCSSEDEYHGRKGTLKCLTDKRGNITWARLDDVIEHFEVLKLGDKEEYRFLCPDGEIKLLDDDPPCAWLSKPWKTVISRKHLPATVYNFIVQELLDIGRFHNLFEESEKLELFPLPDLVTPFRTPKDYLMELFPAYYSLRDHMQCEPDRKVKWCVTTSIEYRKCKWLSDSAKSHGVEPSIECVQESSAEECLLSVKNGNSDIFVSKSQSVVESERRSFKPVVSMMSNVTNNEVVAWVKNTDYQIKSFEDLKNHKACFSGYRDTAWNSFIYHMKHSTGNDNWYCKDAEMVSNYFGSSCVINLDKISRSFPTSLYKLCPGIKDSYPPGFNVKDELALYCLDHYGDVAFLNIDKRLTAIKEKLLQQYSPLCFNESVSESDPKVRCSLNLVTLGSVLVRIDISKAREHEIYLMLLELNELFDGIQFKSVTPQMTMYGPFEGEKDVIFYDSTTYIERFSDRIPRIPYYGDILENIEFFKAAC